MLIQTSEMTKFENKKEALNTKLIYCKEILLKFEEKEKQWERDARLWFEKKKDFETNQTKLENELKDLKEKDKGQQVQVI